MNEPTPETILQLIDKIITYADNQPLILNHLHVLRPIAEALELRVSSLEAEAKNDTLRAQLKAAEEKFAAIYAQQQPNLPPPNPLSERYGSGALG